MSDELATVLRELAEAHEAPPPTPAAEVRTRARRRSHRRRATVRLGLATSVAGMLATIGLTVHAEEPGHDSRHTPATSSGTRATGTPTSSPRAPEAAAGRPAGTAEAVLDLGRHTLTVGGRVMRVNSYLAATPLPHGHRLTVWAKHEAMLLRSDAKAGNAYEAKVPYVVELRTGDGAPAYAGALAFDTRSLGALDARTSWLGLGVDDARWFYTRARRGEHIEITSVAAPAPPEATTDPTAGAGPETGTATSRPRT
ncbi:hypothetical protein [Streptomyces sp. KMM 9044]|uniref:hypothetical protein n=1 Tax=Streptomyces sp. KMM 9044 TaxID=2744474 RepID=UPI002151AAFA|nr:hypothetical protein [Streptomyces sp. KMM 9044]WAX77982.1 hypothetical protein HUV60_010145 [Streptomyces sp. KMM 9044]